MIVTAVAYLFDVLASVAVIVVEVVAVAAVPEPAVVVVAALVVVAWAAVAVAVPRANLVKRYQSALGSRSTVRAVDALLHSLPMMGSVDTLYHRR